MAEQFSPDGERLHLSPKEMKFCEEYVSHNNKSLAFRNAGYKSGNPNTVFNRPKVQRKMMELLAAKDERTRYNKAKIRSELARLSKDAEDAGQYGNAIRALELLGKSLGMFTDVLQTNITTDRSKEEIESDIGRLLAKGRTINKSKEAEVDTSAANKEGEGENDPA